MKVKVVWVETERTRHQAVIDVDGEEYEAWLAESKSTHTDNLLSEFLQSGRDEYAEWLYPAQRVEVVRPVRLDPIEGGYEQTLETASIEEE